MQDLIQLARECGAQYQRARQRLALSGYFNEVPPTVTFTESQLSTFVERIRSMQSSSVHLAAPGTNVPSAYENQTPATKQGGA